jgi:hypothetical protein
MSNAAFIGWLKSAFPRRIVESEALRGAKNAKGFLASDPSPEEFLEYWGSARACNYFDKDPRSQAYDRAASRVLEPHLARYRALAAKQVMQS